MLTSGWRPTARTDTVIHFTLFTARMIDAMNQIWTIFPTTKRAPPRIRVVPAST